ncbi:MAG: Rid family hydrolase [Lautropia sp.]
MPRTPLVPKGSAPPLAPYSPGVKSGNMVFVSGVLPMDAKGATVGRGDVRAQTRQVIESIRAILEAGGATLDDVTMNTIILKDLSDYAAMNSVYAEYFGRNPPARYCIRADLVKPDFLVEIASIAVVDR